MEPRRRPADKCSWHNANCVERPLSQLFQALGRLVATCPWPFLLAPILLSGGLGSGFQRLQELKADDIEEQFTPLGGPAKAERDVVRLYFSTDDATRFSAPRLPTEGAYAGLIVVAADEASVLGDAALSEVRQLDADVRALDAYEQLCARSGGACASPNPLLALLAAGAAPAALSFPTYNGTFLGAALGGVRTDGSGRLLGARALKLLYYLREGSEADRWLSDFIRLIPELLRTRNYRAIEVTYFTSLSRQEEFEGNTKTVIPLFSITYFLTITFSIVSCLRLSCVKNNIWLASCGVVSAGLAVLSSFGLMLYCGVPFVITVANAPFLILGVGVDDMFIMIACWEKSVKEVEKSDTKARMAETYTDAAVSVTITTLTDVLAFFIGTWTAFPSVRSFCLYTGTAFIFCYVYTLTFFGAVLVLNHQREKKERHWLTCMPVKTDEDKSKSGLYNVCCIGNCSGESSESEHDHPMSKFFERYYGPFLTNKWTKLLMILLYGAYVGGSVYGCTQIKEGIDLRNLASDDSYVIPYYNDDDKYFSEYGPRVMVVINGSVEYWNEPVRVAIENCMQSLEDISYVDKNLSESWLAVYTKIAEMASININNKDTFIKNLPMLFRFYPDFEWDINKTQDKIEASRFFIQTVNVTSAVDEKNLLNKLRDTAKQCSLPLMLYHPAFIYYDQYLVIVQNTIQNVLIAAGAMLVVSLVLIPNPFCCLWVTFAIASVIIGVAGFMTFWHVNLDSISMINLVICIGFSVDFSAHISYAFVSSEKPSGNERAVDALHALGYPVLQGAISTILGVVVLAAARTYIFRTFFKIMFLVILFGALHGLVFIPVFLTFFGSFGRSHPDPVPEEGLKTETRFRDDKDCP